MKKTTLNKMVDLILKNDEFVIADIKTLGSSQQKDSRIIEIGALVIKNGEVIETYQRLINPETKIPSKIVKLTGITDDMLINEKTYVTVLNEFYEEVLKDKIIVMHKASYDWGRHIEYYLNKLGIFPINEVIDTLKLSEDVYKEFKKHNLETLCKELNIINEQEHRALGGAKVTKDIFLKLKNYYIKNSHNYVTNTGFLLDDPQTKYAKKRLSIDYLIMKIKKIKYCEENIDGIKHQRIYVTLNFGEVYYDISSKTWFLKGLREEYEGINVDFKTVELKACTILGLKNRKQLSEFRN